MATVRGMHQLAGRALVDEEFRARLKPDPVAAGREERVRITKRDAAFIESLNWDEFEKIGQDLHKVMPRSAAAWGGSFAPDHGKPTQPTQPAQRRVRGGR